MAYSERVHEVAAFAKSAAPQPSVAPAAMREFIGWQLSPNPFDLVKSSGGQQFASSIESVTARAAELCASQKWFAAEDHLHSAIWLAIADGNALWCVDAGIKLAELYLAMNELESTRALCLQLTPIATRIGMHDRALALCTAITLSAEMLGADEMARNATLRDTALCLQSVHESVRVSMQMHRMHRELFLNVCALLADTAYENRLSAWRWGWAHVAQLPQLGVSVSVNGAQTA
jgi:hypothetical protein